MFIVLCVSYMFVSDSLYEFVACAFFYSASGLMFVILVCSIFFFLFFFVIVLCFFFFFFSSRRRHTRCLSDWSSDVCSSDLVVVCPGIGPSLGYTPRLPRSRVSPNCVSGCEPSAVTENVGKRRVSATPISRSEERRVGKECRSRGGEEDEKKEGGR